MAAPARVGLIAVAIREACWIWRDKVALLLVVGVPLIAFALLAMTFSNAVIRDLRVDVVDQDHSPTSLVFVQAVEAAPGVSVAQRSSDLNEAMRAIKSGKTIATVLVPDHFERDILEGRRPKIVIFHNKQLFTPGNVASSALQAAVSAASATLSAGAAKGAYSPGPLVVEQFVLTNPALNYAQFLLRAILPTVLHVMIAIAGGFSVGSEFKSRDVRDWLETAGGSPLTALVGKLAPYFCAFTVMMALGLLVIHGFFEVPFRGDSILTGAAACLMIVSYLAIGALAQLVVKNLATGLALTGIICSPAFGFAGVGFPILSMTGFARAWGAMLPLRWYIEILFDQAARGTPPRESIAPFLWLSALAIGYFGLAWLLTRRLARQPAAVAAPLTPAADGSPGGGRPGVVGAFTAEYRRVLGDTGAFGLIVLAPLLYGALYPQPYVAQLIRDIPIAVVDDDSTDLSRTILQVLNASEAIKVMARPSTLADARVALARRQVFGIVGIPAGAERDMLEGRGARLPVYVDSAYFLLYNRAIQGVQQAVATASGELVAGTARADGALFQRAMARSSPVEIVNQPLFNPTGGYGGYIVPAAFMLILQQTLVMGAATLGGVAYETGGLRQRRRRGAPAAVVGQALAHLLLSLPAFALYLIVLPRVYGFSSNGSPLEMFALAIPFILSVSFMGQFVGAWFKRRETAVLLLIAVSLPLFFLVGLAWPPEAIPEILRRLSVIVPSTSGIDGLVRINQMGATLGDVSADWGRLWILAVVYAALAMVAGRFGGGAGASKGNSNHA
jgi:ABC-2 type transport system permease protein